MKRLISHFEEKTQMLCTKLCVRKSRMLSPNKSVLVWDVSSLSVSVPGSWNGCPLELLHFLSATTNGPSAKTGQITMRISSVKRYILFYLGSWSILLFWPLPSNPVLWTEAQRLSAPETYLPWKERGCPRCWEFKGPDVNICVNAV